MEANQAEYNAFKLFMIEKIREDENKSLNDMRIDEYRDYRVQYKNHNYRNSDEVSYMNIKIYCDFSRYNIWDIKAKQWTH